MEEILKQLGSPGAYHWVVLVLLAVLWSGVTVNNILPAFIAVDPGCNDIVRRAHPDQETIWNETVRGSLPSQNLSYSSADDSSVWFVSNTSQGNWSVRVNVSEPSSSCTPSDLEITIVTEWDLRGKRGFLASLSTAFYFGGIMIGGFIIGPLADRFGRKPILAGSVYATSLLGVIVYFMPYFEGFVAIRFFMGICVQGISTLVIVLCLELFSVQHRVKVIFIAEVIWALSIIGTAGLGYVLTDWRQLQLAVTLPALLTLSYFWWLPESFRWLIKKKKTEAAIAILLKASRFNKVPLDLSSFHENAAQLTSQSVSVAKKSSFSAIFSSQIPKRMAILFVVWFLSAVVYYTLTLGVGKLGASVSQSLLIGASLELVSYFPGIMVVKKFGRRKALVMDLVCAGMLCIISGLLSQFGGKTGKTAAIYVALTGRLFAGLCFQVNFLWTAELFPTQIRSTALSLCNCMARAGGIAAPFLVLASDSFLELPRYAMGSSVIVAGFMVLLLPETMDADLPDTLQESDNLGKQSKTSYEADDVGASQALRDMNGMAGNGPD